MFERSNITFEGFTFLNEEQNGDPFYLQFNESNATFLNCKLKQNTGNLLFFFASNITFKTIHFEELNNVELDNSIISFYDSNVNITALHMSNLSISCTNNLFAIFSLIGGNLFVREVMIENINFNACSSLFQFLSIICATLEEIKLTSISINNDFDGFHLLNFQTDSNRKSISGNFLLINFSSVIIRASEHSNYILFSLQDDFESILIKNSIFVNISQCNNIMRISNKNSNLLLQNLKFNRVSAINVLLIENLKMCYFENLTFSHINNQNNLNNDRAESCLHLRDAQQIIIDKLKILYTFSKNAASGINIISSLSDENSKKIVCISNTLFLNNYNHFSDENEGLSSSFTIQNFDINLFILMLNSYFFKNEISHTSNDKKRISSPCLSFTTISNVLIKDSFFKENYSNTMGNCISVNAYYLKIEDSLFLNNTLSTYSQAEFQFLKKFKYGPLDIDYSQAIQNSKGGAIYFSGDYMLVSSCYFVENKAYDGSAIFFNDLFTAQTLLHVILESSYFVSNQAISHSLIDYKFFGGIHDLYIGNCFFEDNRAFEGGILGSYNGKKGNIYKIGNVFWNNDANTGPVTCILVGEPRFFNERNFYYGNRATARSVKISGIALTIGIINFNVI